MIEFLKSEKGEKVMYAAKDIAKYTVNKCIEDCRPISNLQLQKILYFCQKGYNKNTGLILFDDDFEAWQYGPVIPSVYRMFSLFGGMKVNRKVHEDALIDNIIQSIINPIIERYSSFTAWDLVSMTHQKDNAWDQVYQGGEGKKKVIPKDLIFS